MMAKINIKTGLLLFCGLCFSTNIAKAQGAKPEDDRKFYGGVTFGTNFSQVTGDYMEGYRKVSINAGVMTYFVLDENIAGSIELLYSEKGSAPGKKDLPYPNINNTTFYKTYGIKLPYAEIPLLINYFDKNKSNLGAGFSYGQLFNAKEFLDTFRTETIYPFQKYDVNVILNANLRLVDKLSLNLRFAHSLLNIRKEKNILLNHRDQQFSKLFALRLVYLF
jgi:Outer membrane protein beta-barrel domain